MISHSIKYFLLTCTVVLPVAAFAQTSVQDRTGAATKSVPAKKIESATTLQISDKRYIPEEIARKYGLKASEPVPLPVVPQPAAAKPIPPASSTVKKPAPPKPMAPKPVPSSVKPTEAAPKPKPVELTPMPMPAPVEKTEPAPFAQKEEPKPDTKSVAPQPVAPKPVAPKPEPQKSNTSQSKSPKPMMPEPVAPQPVAPQSEPLKPMAPQPEPLKPMAPKPEPLKPMAPQPEPLKPMVKPIDEVKSKPVTVPATSATVPVKIDSGQNTEQKTWTAAKGEEIKTVLTRWSEKEGTKFNWTRDKSATVTSDFSYTGQYDEAVAQLMQREFSTKKADAPMTPNNNVIDKKNIPATNPQPVAPQPMPSAPPVSEPIAPVSTDAQAKNETAPSKSSQKPMEKTSVPAKSTAPIQPVTTKSPVAKPVSGPKNWYAARGTSLESVLQGWADQENVELVWKTKERFTLETAVTQKGQFDDAVAALLKTFSKQSIKPSVEFGKYPGTGRRVIRVVSSDAR